MRPEVEQELAHTLLVELLAYQFASPVRWIETQDEILVGKTAERLVEIGPADTLGTMAKRTLATKYEAYDVAKSLQRQILCYSKDTRDIYYQFDTPPEEQAGEGDTLPPESSPAPTAPQPSTAEVATNAAVPIAASAEVVDEPVKAIDIVRSLVAQKLKVPLLQIPINKNIKDMVGGKLFGKNDPRQERLLITI